MGLLYIWNYDENIIKSTLKVSTMRRRKNSDTNFQTALAVFSIIILACVFLFELSPKTKPYYKKNIVDHFKHAPKSTHLMFWRFVKRNWFQLLLFYFCLALSPVWDQFVRCETVVQDFSVLHCLLLCSFKT